MGTFRFLDFWDAPERASTVDMTVDAGEAAAHARAVVTVFHFIAYSLAGFAFGFAVFVNVYVMIALDDLQSDFVNPHDATRRINRLIAWEIGAHACGCAFMLVGGHWVMVLANAPLVYYHYVGARDFEFILHSFFSFALAVNEGSLGARTDAGVSLCERIAGGKRNVCSWT